MVPGQADPVQQEFDAAIIEGADTLRTVGQVGSLTHMPIDRLQQMAWDLERVAAALHREIDTRLDGPVDTA